MKEKVRLNDGGLSVEIEYDFRIVVTRSQFSIINSKSKASRQFLEKSMVGFNLCHLMSVGLDLHRVDTFNVFTNSAHRYTRIQYSGYVVHLYRWLDGVLGDYVLTVFVELQDISLQDAYKNFNKAIPMPAFNYEYQRDIITIKSLYFTVIKDVYEWLSYFLLGIYLIASDIVRVDGSKSSMYSLCKNTLMYKLFLRLQDMSYCADTNKYVVVSIRDRDVLPKDISNEDILYVLSIMDSYQSAVNRVVNEGVGTNDCMPTVVFIFDMHGGVRRDDGYIKITITSYIPENDIRLYDASYGDINHCCSVIVGHGVSLQHTITYRALSHITLHIFCDVRLLEGYAYFICRENEEFDIVTMVSTCHRLRSNSIKQLNALPGIVGRGYQYFSINNKIMYDIDAIEVVDTVGVMLNKGYTISTDKVVHSMYNGKAFIY